MANYLKTYNLAHDEDFRKRVQTAVLLEARDILDDGNDEQVGPRYVLARQALRLDQPALDRFAWECALNPQVADAEVASPGSAPDSDLAFGVSTVWDTVAGAA